MKLPSSEIIWTSYFDTDHRLRFVITSKADRNQYHLFAVDGDDYTRIDKADSPIELDERNNIRAALGMVH